MNVDGGIVDGGCNVEVLSDGVGEEKWVGRDVNERDGVINEGDKFSTIHVTRPVLMNSGVAWEGIWWKDFGWFKFGLLLFL